MDLEEMLPAQEPWHPGVFFEPHSAGEVDGECCLLWVQWGGSQGDLLGEAGTRGEAQDQEEGEINSALYKLTLMGWVGGQGGA